MVAARGNVAQYKTPMVAVMSKFAAAHLDARPSAVALWGAPCDVLRIGEHQQPGACSIGRFDALCWFYFALVGVYGHHLGVGHAG